MPTVKDVAFEDLHKALIEIRSGIGPLSQANDDYKTKREDAMFDAARRALDALARIQRYENA